ncbi:unnamed protein product [Paramecium sonneborni]|uniref:Uncharacterized protein n=1 Tax=Paramecium sonneborni TaxID=65129 RepID=A0A8S1MI30_9CILI|nr:unnamed protein product [Paramecium sonneborni]
MFQKKKEMKIMMVSNRNMIEEIKQYIQNKYDDILNSKKMRELDKAEQSIN